MKTFEEIWELLITQDENNIIEVKQGSEVGKSCKQTICAFANEPGLGGGYLVLGITDSSRSKSGEYEIAGVKDPDKIQKDLSSICNDETFNYRFRPNIQPETIEGKTVIIAYIPEVPVNEKPIYIRKEGLPKGAFRRIGSTDIKCSDKDLELFYQERKAQCYDTTFYKEANLDDLDPQAINAYRQLRTKVNPNASELSYDDQELLYAINAIIKHPDQPKTYCPTVAGLIVFGKAPALRRYFPMHRIDYMIVEGTEWASNPDQRYQYAIEIREALLLAIPKLVSTIINDLPKSFHLPKNELQRQDIPLIPVKVIREAIVNAVMHRNYRVASPIQIIRYSDRLEIRNAGYSLKPLNSLEEITQPGSLSRNETIATILHELNMAETKGTGGRTMIEEMLEANLSLPKFDSQREKDYFCLTLWTHHLIGKKEIKWLKQFKSFNLNNEEARALIILKQVGHLNNEIYRFTNNVDTLKASKALIKLRDLGLLQSHGKGTATYYTLSPHFTLSGELDDSNLESSTSGEDLSGELADSNLESSTSGEDLSGELALDFSSDELPATIKTSLENLGSRGRSQKEIRDLIIELCRIKHWSSHELATILQRSQKYLLEKYLKPLVDEGLLAYTNPDIPNDPFQTYKIPDSDA